MPHILTSILPTMFESVLVYTTTILVMLVCIYKAQCANPYKLTQHPTGINVVFYFWLLIAFLVFSFVFGIRYDVGVDHSQYVDIYLYGYDYKQKELLYVIWNNAFSLAKMPYPLFFASISFALISTFILAFKKEPFLFFFLVLFIFFDGQVNSWNNIIRVSIACCIWIYSINYIANKNFVSFLICYILAVGFHYSSILLILAYPFLYRGKNYFKHVSLQLGLLVVAFIFRFLFSSFLESIMQMIDLYAGVFDSYAYYANSADTLERQASSGTNLVFYIRIIVNVIIIKASPSLHKFYNDRKFNIIYNLYFIGLLFNYALPAGYIVLNRQFVFLWVFSTIILAYFAYYLYATHKKSSLVLLLVLYAGFYYGSLVRSIPNPDAHVKYQTFKDYPSVSLLPKYKPHSLIEN